MPGRYLVEEEITRLEPEGLIEPIDFSTTPTEWASPLVIVLNRMEKFASVESYYKQKHSHIPTPMTSFGEYF